MILSAHPGLQAPSRVSHSEGGGSLLGKQLQRGSLIKSHPKIVESSRYLRPAQQCPCQARVSTLHSCSSCSRICTWIPPKQQGPLRYLHPAQQRSRCTGHSLRSRHQRHVSSTIDIRTT